MKYHIVYEREPDGRWTVEAPNVPGCHSYGRTIEQARERIREALSLFIDNAATAKFEEVIKLPEPVLRTVATAKQLRAKVIRDTEKSIQAHRKAVMSLRHKMHLGLRDAGELLGVSHQRVQQIENDIPVMPGAVVTATQRSRFKRASKKR